jgi:hypothetical protein
MSEHSTTFISEIELMNEHLHDLILQIGYPSMTEHDLRALYVFRRNLNAAIQTLRDSL